MTTIRIADLNPAGHTSFSFYDFLPGSGFAVEGAPAAMAAPAATSRLLAADLLTVSDEALDSYAALLLTHGHRLKPTADMERLADATARGFAALIGNDAMRPRRMRLTRTSLMLRVIIDRTQDTSSAIAESTLASKSPWDLLGDWAVTCDDDNVRRLKGNTVTWSRRLGLPTQLDMLRDALWVGSHYSPGGYVVSDLTATSPRVEFVTHDAPLVLAFDFNGARYALDANGALFDVDGSVLGMKLLQLAGKVHRARVIGNMLYAFDWGQAGIGFAIELDTLAITVFSTGPVIVCNDVCGDENALYAICKLQGRVFKMARGSKHVATRLGAGVQRGQLLDPIMIRRNADGTLNVLNWFSSKLVRMQAF